LPDSFEQAYCAADTIVVETDPSDTQAMMQAAPMMVYPGNEKLEQHLRPATWKKLQQHTGGQTAGFQMMRTGRGDRTDFSIIQFRSVQRSARYRFVCDTPCP
jgi:uncharacterized protein YbaP (TraB family)